MSLTTWSISLDCKQLILLSNCFIKKIQMLVTLATPKKKDYNYLCTTTTYLERICSKNGDLFREEVFQNTAVIIYFVLDRSIEQRFVNLFCRCYRRNVGRCLQLILHQTRWDVWSSFYIGFGIHNHGIWKKIKSGQNTQSSGCNSECGFKTWVVSSVPKVILFPTNLTPTVRHLLHWQQSYLQEQSLFFD